MRLAAVVRAFISSLMGASMYACAASVSAKGNPLATRGPKPVALLSDGTNAAVNFSTSAALYSTARDRSVVPINRMRFFRI